MKAYSPIPLSTMDSFKPALRTIAVFAAFAFTCCSAKAMEIVCKSTSGMECEQRESEGYCNEKKLEDLPTILTINTRLASSPAGRADGEGFNECYNDVGCGFGGRIVFTFENEKHVELVAIGRATSQHVNIWFEDGKAKFTKFVTMPLAGSQMVWGTCDIVKR